MSDDMSTPPPPPPPYTTVLVIRDGTSERVIDTGPVDAFVAAVEADAPPDDVPPPWEQLRAMTRDQLEMAASALAGMYAHQKRRAQWLMTEQGVKSASEALDVARAIRAAVAAGRVRPEDMTGALPKWLALLNGPEDGGPST